MFLARFSTNLPRKIDLTNAFKSFFATILLSRAAKSPNSLGNRVRGPWGVRARARAPPRLWNFPRPLPEPFLRGAGKGLAHGQVAIIDPT